MAEENLFNLIKKEKKNINIVSLSNINNFYCKYYLKSLLCIKKNLEDFKTEVKDDKDINVDFLFENNISKIGNMLFNIFWIIFFYSFNIHITIFFIERATLLFSEFISLSLKEKKYVVESKSNLNDAIIFTYKKTIEYRTLENIENENKFNKDKEFQEKYQKILKVRDGTYLLSQIINKISLSDIKYIENSKNNNKNLILLIFNIYQTIDIDKYLFFKINKLLKDFKIDKALYIMRIIVENINEFINLNFFDFNFEEKDIKNFEEFLDLTLTNFINDNLFDNISYNTQDIINKKIYIQFKECMFRYINN
jgi:hypothetical protein